MNQQLCVTHIIYLLNSQCLNKINSTTERHREIKRVSLSD